MRAGKIAILSFLLMTISVTGFCQTTSTVTDTSASSSAKIVFMRSTGFNGSAAAFTTFIDDQLVCRLNNKSFSTHSVQPGEHTFSVQFAGKGAKAKAERISIKVEPTKTYYIQLVFQPGLMVNNLYCQEVTESSANTMLPKLKEDAKCL